MSKDVLHVVPHNEGWGVKREGNERNSSTHVTQKEAIDAARELAKEGDDIVVHRPDGTIRDRTTYTKENGNVKVRPSDVYSVGSRVSWPAVLAGAVVALALYITLLMLAVAISVTGITDYLANRTFAIGAAVVVTFALLASLFLGGYIASLTTTRENKTEALIYGVLVWGVMSALMFAVSSTMTLGFSSMLRATPQSPDASATLSPDVVQQLQLTEDQRTKLAELRSEVTPAMAAWWGFGTLVLSLLTAMGGSYLGSGPEFAFRWLGPRREGVPQKTVAGSHA